MDLVKEYKEKSNFDSQEDIANRLVKIFMHGSIISNYKSDRIRSVKGEFNELLIKLLEEMLSNDLSITKKEKLEVINLLDELNFRIEILGMMNEKNKSNLVKASKSIGKKFMSSIEK